MGTSGNKIDSNLTAANIKSGVQIFGLTGSFIGNQINALRSFFLGTYGTRSDSTPFVGTSRRTIELSGFVYCFCVGSYGPGGSTARGAACIAAKINKTTGAIQIIGGLDGSSATSGSAPVIVSSYIDATVIRVNCTGGSGSIYFALNTTNDAFTVTNGTNTTGTLTNTLSVVDAGIAYEAMSTLPQYAISPFSSVPGAMTGYAYIHPTPYTYDSVGIEVNAPGNTQLREGGFFMKDDGTAFYIQNAFNGTIQQYTLGTPWDLSTYSYLSQTVITRYGMYRGNSGQYQYSVLGQTTDRVYRMTASTPWLLSTLGSSQNYNPSAQCADVKGVWLNDTGTKMYLLDAGIGTGFGGTNTIYQYTLATPYQISSGVTYDSVSYVFTPEDSNINAISFSTDGLTLYACGGQYGLIYKYSLSVAWDLSTIAYSGSYINYGVLGLGTAIAIGFKSDVSKAYIANNTNTSSASIFNITQFSTT